MATAPLPREDVAAALFSLLLPLAGGNPFNIVSRRLIPAQQIAGGQSPCVFQMEDVETRDANLNTMKGHYVSSWRFVWVIYSAATAAGDQATPPSISLNNCIDAVMAVLPPTPGSALLIDTVQCPFYWDGSINYVEGIIANMSVAEIPIIVRVPWAQPT